MRRSNTSTEPVTPERVLCVGFPLYKQGYVPSFVQTSGTRARFVTERGAARSLRPGDAILLWGTQERHRPVVALAARSGIPVWRMEDGFLRSVGLGSDLEQPLSLVVDERGIYYDPRTVSDLEWILANHRFTDEELRRARALRAAIVEAGISKYNVGSRRRVGLGHGGRPVVLVVGQVEDDASIQRGALDVRRNEDLLRAARIDRPHAYLVYKPHPDVVRGHRRDTLPIPLARRLSDEVVLDASLADCLDAARQVHTITSLVGFEALLRGIHVFAHGQPFYSGWGLTEDRHPHPRRTRSLTLDELVAGTLILYPRYVDPATGRRTTPEATLRRLLDADRSLPLRRLGSMGRHLRRLRNIARGAFARVV